MKRCSLLCLFLLLPAMLAGCRETAEETALPPINLGTAEETAPPASEESGKALMARFLSGDFGLLDNGETWGLDSCSIFSWGDLEYTYLDLDGDGIEELLVQWADSPANYNGVFHFDGNRLRCWQSDAVEGSCRDYPLRDGTMVRQYDYGGGSTYTLFRYQADGSTEDAHSLFVREELIPEDSANPCPYYEIDGEEVSKAVFEEWLSRLITSQLLERSAWTALSGKI